MPINQYTDIYSDISASYNRPNPSAVPSRNTAAPAPKSRPLPTVPGAPPTSRPPVAVPPTQPYGYVEPQRSTGNLQQQYAANPPYISQPAPPSHDSSYAVPPTHYSHAYVSSNSAESKQPNGYTHQSHNSDLAGSATSHNSTYTLDSIYQSVDSQSGDPRYLSQSQGSFEGYPSSNADASAQGYQSARPNTAQQPIGYTNNTVGPYPDRSSSYSHEALVVDPRIEPYSLRVGGYQPNASPHSSESYHNPNHFQNPPLLDDGGDDAGYTMGNNLLRVNSFASVGSLLQEPRHSPVTDGSMLTPTSSNPPHSISHGPSPAHQLAYTRYNDYVAPVIATTPTAASASSSRRRNLEMDRIASMKGPLAIHEDEEEEEDEELEEDRFVNLSLLSHLANRLRDRVPRGTHVKGSIPYPRAFTGKDIVVRILFRTFE